MSKEMEQLKAELAALQSKLADEHAQKVDPIIEAKAKSLLNFDLAIAGITMQVFGIKPTASQMNELGDKLLQAKIESFQKNAEKEQLKQETGVRYNIPGITIVE